MAKIFPQLLNWQLWVLPTAVSLLLIGVAQYNFLVFHIVAELFPITIAFVMFALAWSTYDFSKNTFLTFLACGYLWIGILDLTHTLAYKGMDIFVFDDGNIPTQLWVVTRFAEALLLVAAPFFARRDLNKYLLTGGFGLVAAVMVALVMAGFSPTMFIGGVGLTQFKINSEYAIELILVLALFSLFRHGRDISLKERVYISLSIVLSMCAELAFTFYVDVYGLSNLAGHIFKLFSFWLIYQAVVSSSLKQPYFELKTSLERLSLAQVQLQKLSHAVEQSSATVIIADTDGNIEYVNRKFVETSGYSKEEAIGHNPRILKSGYTSPEEYKTLWNTISSGNEWRGEFHNKSKDGTLYWEASFISPIKSSDGVITSYIAIKNDITDRKRVDEELWSKNRTVKLLEMVAVAANEASHVNEALQKCLDLVCDHTDWPVGHVYMFDDDTGDLYPTEIWHLDNAAVFATFRKVTEETRFAPGVGLPGRVLSSGKPAWIVDVTQDANFPRAKLAKDIGVKAGFAFPILVGDKVAAVLEFFSQEKASPVPELLDVMAHVGTQIGRVVERTKANEEIVKAKEAAEYANHAKTQFLANMSHELRTPLNGIIGFSEMMKQQVMGAMPKAYLDYATDIHNSGHHLLELITDILDTSKLDMGVLELHETEVDLHEVAAACITLVEHKANEVSVTLSIDIPADIPNLKADETRVKEILINLLSNALKFTPPNGQVIVDAHLDEEGAVIVRVKDNGCGIAVKDIPKVMEPFKQVEDIFTRSHEGSGLGLPLSKRLIELHGGALVIDSELGTGTTVTVRFPPERVVANA